MQLEKNKGLLVSSTMEIYGLMGKILQGMRAEAPLFVRGVKPGRRGWAHRRENGIPQVRKGWHSGQ
jgi:hypothetical protein